MDKEFFKTVSLAAFGELLRGFAPLAAQSAGLLEAHGRYLSEDVVAGEDLPPVSRSCMDGYALRARDAFGASEGNPAYLECAASLAVDGIFSGELPQGQCAGILTGGSLPAGADAVVMIEHTARMGEATIEIRRSPAPGENVMRAGEDAARGQVALPAATRLRPQEIGLLAALGRERVMVRARPRVAIVSTGDEVVPVAAQARPGQVRDVNSYALACQAREAGGEPKLCGLVPDDAAALRAALEEALAASDAVLISGGSSVGARDYTVAAVEALPGAAVLAHGVAMRPGKPVLLARVGEKAVIGLPGQVTSAQVVMIALGMPFLRHLQGDAAAFERQSATVVAELARNLPSARGREDFIRVRLERRLGMVPLAHPLLGKSGLLSTMIAAGGLARIEAQREGLEAGALVEVIVL
ncbi:MAG: molybdopterin molybdotransferase MoeA [Desulfovibrionaceae bacterium]|nr:molybdopterin molybdotransferase MoeA [Desulfovibrionaceae bacterium]MBF0515048.1 molybdopterin molybdotransferase MoeA [Desulfovibrionaceae bacterium]